MKRFKIRKSLDLPIGGEVENSEDIRDLSSKVTEVALLGHDYPQMKPTMMVKVGDAVRTGQALFEDKKNPGVLYTSPVTGTVKAIHRGEKRVFQSVVVGIEDDNPVSFASFRSGKSHEVSETDIRTLLIESGLWPAFRTRPYSKAPSVDAKPEAIFVTATDTNPLAPNPNPIIKAHQADFDIGLSLISKLCTKNFLCINDTFGTAVDTPNFETVVFTGGHPAGLPGTHIHYLYPVSRGQEVWHISYQDIIAIGKLFSSGQPWNHRLITVAGPGINEPTVAKVLLGSRLTELSEGMCKREFPVRLVSGSVFSGRRNSEAEGYLGRFHLQITGLEEDHKRVLLGWQGPGFDKFSVKPMFLSKFVNLMKPAITSSTNGSPRAIVPIGAYEKVMPLDILPTPLLKALCQRDLETAEKLGCLELDEDDLALCTFVCSGKKNYGRMLRDVLTDIEKGL